MVKHYSKHLSQYCGSYSLYSRTILQFWWSRNVGSIQLPFSTLWGQKVIWSCKSSVQYHAHSFGGTACKNRAKIMARHSLYFIVQHNSMQRFSWTGVRQKHSIRKARNAGCFYVSACGTKAWLLYMPVLVNQRHIIICQYDFFFLIMYEGISLQ